MDEATLDRWLHGLELEDDGEVSDDVEFTEMFVVGNDGTTHHTGRRFQPIRYETA